MIVTDLNRTCPNCDPVALFGTPGVTAYVHRKSHIYSSNGTPADAHIPALRSTLSRQPQNKNIFLSRSISLHGICPAYLSGKPSGHRGLSPRTTKQALPHGYPRRHIPQHFSQCQQGSRLAYLCRLCSVSYPNRPQTLCGRRHRNRTRQYGLCARRHYNRSLSFCFSLGPFSYYQSRRQIAHITGFTGLYPNVYPYIRRQNARRQRSRPALTRGRCLLCHGSRLRRFSPSSRSASGLSVLRHPGQIQSSMSSDILSTCRQEAWSQVRSNCSSYRILFRQGLSRETAANQVLRCRDRQTPHLLDQQFFVASNDNHRAIPLSLASRAIFQMDQTTSSDKVIFWNFGKCGKDSNLDCSGSLRTSRYHQKAPQTTYQPLYDITDSECDYFRKYASKTGVVG